MVKIGLDDKKFKEGVRKAEKETKNFGDKAKSFMNTAKKIAIGGVGVAATVGSMLAKTGIEYNSQMENYTTNFKVMLGGAEEAAKKVEQLKTMAAKTPFGMSELAEATQTLLAFQVPADDTNNILKMLGDVALGNKEKLKGLALVFGQVSSAGKLQGQDLMQLINQGFNPLNYIAKRTGESMNELRDRMSKGGISAEEVRQAFVDATSAGGQFHNGMEEASKTMSGLKSTLDDTVNSKLGEFFEVSSQKATDALPKIIEFVEAIDVKKIVDNLEKLKNGFKTALPYIVSVTGAIAAFKAAIAITALIDAFKNGITATSVAVKLLKASSQALNMVMSANPIVLVVGLLATLVAALVTAYMTNEDFRNKVNKAWESVKTKAIELKDSVVDFFTKKIPAAFNSTIQWLKNNWVGLTLLLVNPVAGALKLLYNNNEGFKKWVDDLIAKVKQLPNKIAESFKSFGEKITASFTGWLDKTSNKVSEWAENVKQWFANLPYNIGFALGQAIAAIYQWGVNTYNYFVTNIPLWIESIKTWFSEIPVRIKEAFDVALQHIIDWITSVGNWFAEIPGKVKDAFDKAVERARDWINRTVEVVSSLPGKVGAWFTETYDRVSTSLSDMKNRAVQGAKDIKESIVNGIKNLPEKMKEMGQNIVKGLWDGWANMKKWIHEKVDEFMQGLVDGAKSKLGIHSPSKVFAGIGGYMAEGLGEGWDEKYANIQRGINDSLNFETGTASVDGSYNGSHGGYGSKTIYYSPTVNVNASDYSSGRDFVNEMLERFQEAADEERRVSFA